MIEDETNEACRWLLYAFARAPAVINVAVAGDRAAVQLARWWWTGEMAPCGPREHAGPGGKVYKR